MTLLRRILPRILLLLLTAYVLFCTGLFLFQRALIYFPQPRAIQAPQSTLLLPVAEGKLIITVRPTTGRKAIIYFGGNAEDVSVNLPEFAQSFPEHALYLLHYPGYGGSAGAPSEQAIAQDAQALFDRVHAEHPEIAIIGRSLGTGVAVRLASQRPASRLILITPYDSLQEIAAAQFPYVPVRWLLRDTYDSGHYAPSITIPTTLIAAGDDRLIPAASTKRLFTRFGKGVASLRVIPATDHYNISASRDYLPAIEAGL